MKLEWYTSKSDSWTLCDHHVKDKLKYTQPPDKKAIERAIKGYAAVEKNMIKGQSSDWRQKLKKGKARNKQLFKITLVKVLQCKEKCFLVSWPLKRSSVLWNSMWKGSANICFLIFRQWIWHCLKKEIPFKNSVTLAVVRSSIRKAVLCWAFLCSKCIFLVKLEKALN